MELLIAVLVTLGVVSSNETKTMSKAELEKAAHEQGVSQKEIDNTAKIIGLEEDSM